MFRSMSRYTLVAAALCLASAPTMADASPWTLPKDKFVLTLDSNYQSADEEYLPDGELQQFPLDGEFTAITFSVGARYGITDKIELAGDLNLKQINYKSAPVLLEIPDGADSATLNDAIFDFSKSAAGVGDAELHGRYALVRGLVRVTSQTSVQFPVGYETPRGTFLDDEPNPAAIEDDVTLGDGQTNLTQSFLFGAYVPATRSFARLDAGYRLRVGTPGDQTVGGVSIGQYLGDNFLVFVAGNGAYTLFEGESIGKSFITRSPGKSPSEFDATEDIETIDITLDKDYLNVEGGVILKLRDLEMRASYGQIVWGSNIPRISSFSLGVVYALDNVTAE
ncbi:hypothetical protein FIV42_05965 [Persicimonas caeni]|uniref:Transporter n=1 Tax=Persicimonas caeni TaxID=2292766 RepID=A0A4Y6PQ03_PERCE|nr:hypothetical protein [Persicimonas caeni]QDG50293.1 hypothetical protein FIV42_05965 [Persicimonas caeni]QED31514.1 hypothetical protein FRD00_05960 [Persicimonas caeni]